MYKPILSSSTNLPYIGIVIETPVCNLSTEFDNNNTDFLYLFSLNLKSKLEAIITKQKQNSFNKQNYTFPKIIIKILECKSITQLLKVVEYSLKNIFEFEHIEMIFYNSKSIFAYLLDDMLYKNILDKESGTILKLDDCPTNSGIAGIAFTENRAVYGVVGRTKYLFQEIDHVVMNGDVLNFLFLPLYGYNEDLVGILELVNRKGGLPDENELEKFDVYQRSIGLMIKHIEEIYTTRFASDSLSKIMKYLNKLAIDK